MPTAHSYADILRDWELLLDAGARSPDIQASLEVERLMLEQSLTTVRNLKARQDELTALRQQVTQELRAAVTQGRDAAIQFRALVKAKLGPRTERLVHYKMTPIRRRPRKKAEEEKPVPAVGAAPVVN